MNKAQHQSVIQSFIFATESISYSLKLSQLLLDEQITADDFKKASALPHVKEIDWSKDPKAFMEQAQTLPLATVAFAIVACTEGYFDLAQTENFDLTPKRKKTEREKNLDLYSAQMILKILRNSFGHPHISAEGQLKIRWNIENPDYRNRYEIKEINMLLDARDLNEKDFKLSDIGGWEKLWALLDYLKNDLSNRQKLLSDINHSAHPACPA